MDLTFYLQSARSSLFRFEYLQYFDIPEEKAELEEYVRTGEINTDSMKEWWDFLETKKKEGVVLQRVRLVKKPITKYVEMELKIHKESAKYGDEIRVLPEEKLTAELESLGDFWIIDDGVVLVMKYGPTGNYLGFEKVLIAPAYLQAKQYLLGNSISLT